MKNTNELRSYYKTLSVTTLEQELYCNESDKENSKSAKSDTIQARLTLKIDLINNELKTRKGLKTFNFSLFGFNINFTKA